ncbi:isthmin-1 isoform X1 [Physeter macrocephalus]|uniref:Isthmin-1 isoform X1 n=1 Tax=Physeter macrocephalus TaxID=9755 RepID=A0A455C4F1_PHYMC|nr:isthmin-1 isoform X1 [Physeter catodon]|eukprot:XP_028354773.1 isthmin-1 isoform X1 [Physeter catodon]
MVRLAAELLLLLGLLLLTLHITVLRGSGAADGPDAAAANASRTQLQNNLNMESASTLETSSPLSKETPGEHSDHQAAHQPFPRQQFHQEAGPPSLQRDGPRSFLLDLPNFPDLSKADINGQNPNIQVTIEVVDGPDSEADKDQHPENKPSWSVPSPDWRAWWQRSLSLARANGGDQDYKYDSTSDDSNFLNPPGGWDRPAPGHRTFESKEQPEYARKYRAISKYLSLCRVLWRIQGENKQPRKVRSTLWQSSACHVTEDLLPRLRPATIATGTGLSGRHLSQIFEDSTDGEGDWSLWSVCSVTCGNGNQKRTRSCGYACTATESRTCDRPNCPGIEDTFRTAATEVSLLAGSEEFNATKLFEVDTDSCERWMSCKSEFLKKYMHKVINDLPSCPCSYPTEVAYSTADIFDRIKRKDFRWKDASGPKEKLEIYKPTARYCIRSMLSLESTTLAAQHCCYGDNMQLITRGKGAGTPNLISTEFSAELHYKVDILPWIICKGDWSRYNEARPPNNGQKCTESPSDEDYIKQFQEAREY